ncbi:hypothetical protein [Ruegeria hyattellae]|uniref:hypothetical protein n=1 Tax=Ruegeria hyattellae TaxID=3233337 RepID=UPI00355BA438
MKVKKQVSQILVIIKKDRRPEIKKVSKEYNSLFQIYAEAYAVCRTKAEMSIKARALFEKEVRSDPSSAAETRETIENCHSGAHYQNRLMEICLGGFERLDNELKKAKQGLAV